MGAITAHLSSGLAPSARTWTDTCMMTDARPGLHQDEAVRQVRQGSEEAFERIFRTHYPGLCAFAAGYVCRMDVARDIVQEVFLKIWERRKCWRVRTSLKAYLYGSVRNRALNHVQSAWTTRTTVMEPHSTSLSEPRSPEDELHYKELADAVRRAVRRLPERRRTAFVLHRQQGLSYGEIADVMGISPRTVEGHISKALKHLRESLPIVLTMLP